jgi:DNA-binding NarL/FixJ family response regulator
MCARERGKPLRVLVVDDEPDLRMLLRIGLDYSPEIQVAGEAADGQEAIELISRESIDAVLLDVGMPRMDGIDAARHIRSISPDTKIIVLSALYSPAQGKAVLPEADLFFEKANTSLQRLKDAVLDVCA